MILLLQIYRFLLDHSISDLENGKIRKWRAQHAIFLFYSFFQCGAGQGGQVNLYHPVFGCNDKGLWQIVTGNHLSLPLGLFQKQPRSLGGGGIVHIKDPDHGLFPDRHIITDG